MFCLKKNIKYGDVNGIRFKWYYNFSFVQSVIVLRRSMQNDSFYDQILRRAHLVVIFVKLEPTFFRALYGK